jgi:hypothetical protein
VVAFGAGSAALLSLRGAGASASAPAPYRASGPASHPGHAHGGGALATAPPVAHVGAAPVGYGHGMAPPRAFTREDALALATLGVDAALYDGSLNEWASDPDLPMATGPA